MVEGGVRGVAMRGTGMRVTVSDCAQFQSATTWAIIEFSCCMFATPFSDRKTRLHHLYLLI